MLRTLALALLPALLLAPTGGAGSALVNVTLQIDATAYPVHDPRLPDETKTCAVQVPAGADGVDVLNQATRDGCILGWTATAYPLVDPLQPRSWLFLDSIDGRRAFCDTPLWLVHCTFWALSVNGSPSGTGIGGWRAAEGDVYGFTYDRTFAGHGALP